MRSEAPSVDAYMEEVPHARRGALDALRAQCRALLVGFDEAMVYGMPSYSRDGQVEIAFASQKSYISFYVLRSDVLNGHRGEFGNASLGKGCVRFRTPEQIETRVIAALLEDTSASIGPVC